MNSEGFIQPMNMANINNLNSYQTPVDTFYTPPPPLPVHQQQNRQQYPSSQQTQYSPQMYNQQNTEKFQQFVVDRLTSLDSRLNILDTIEKQLSLLSDKLSSMDTRVTILESSVKTVDTRITEVEASRAFDSQLNDEMKI